MRPVFPVLHVAMLKCVAALLFFTAFAPLAGCTPRDNRPAVVTPEVVVSQLYVAPGGLDSNPGTQAAPLRTLARAAQLVTPGTVVNVLPGTYYGGIRTKTDGRPTARIVFRSTQRWGARIVPPPVSTSDMAWDNRGSWVDIEGFEVDGTLAEQHTGQRWRIGLYSAGSHDRIIGNHVHDVATTIPCTSLGGSGIGVDSYYKGANSEVTGNTVHDIGANGCRFVQGIYVSMPATVRGNVAYRVAFAAIHLWHDARDVVVANNTVAASQVGILVGGGDFYHATGPNDRTRVLNNIVFDNVMGVVEVGATGPHNVYRNNLVTANRRTDWRLAPGMRHTGTVAAKPGFVEYARKGTPDFRLAADSPAIGMGAADAAPPDAAPDRDCDGRPRARRGPADIGACSRAP
jgi:hypothetical protein